MNTTGGEILLRLSIPEITDLFDESTNRFFNIPEQVLILEHSLATVSKWESKWCKSFLSSDDKTPEEILDYIRCMITNEDEVDSRVLNFIPSEYGEEINKFINAPMTATTISGTNNESSRDIITAELVYYWMIAHNIPVQFEHWHLNKLLTLIRVCNEKNSPPKKMSQNEIMQRNKALNEQRLKALNTKG